MDVTLTVTDRQLASAQIAIDRLQTEAMAAWHSVNDNLPPEQQEVLPVPMTMLEYLQLKFTQRLEEEVVVQTSRDLTRVTEALRTSVDTGEFLNRLATAVESNPEGLVALIGPAIGMTT